MSATAHTQSTWPRAAARTFRAALCLGVAVLAAAPAAHANQALATRYACVACHQPERKLVGPSWNDIAGKYAGTATAATQLAESIRKGGSGKWGAVPMPAQPAVNAQDAQALAQWILEHRATPK